MTTANTALRRKAGPEKEALLFWGTGERVQPGAVVAFELGTVDIL